MLISDYLLPDITKWLYFFYVYSVALTRNLRLLAGSTPTKRLVTLSQLTREKKNTESHALPINQHLVSLLGLDIGRRHR